jgi:hypothetical protein
VFRTLLRLAIACVLVVVGWGSSAAAWDTTAGNDTNYGSITFGGTAAVTGYGLAVDGSGNVYTTGMFIGTADLGAGDVTSAGNYDVFVTKRNAAGAHQWTTTFGGTGQDYGREVAVDGSGNVYIAGHFSNTVDFGAGNVGSSGSYDGFVTKLNSAGAHQWTTTFGSTNVDDGTSVAVDGSGNVHITGYFQGTVDFGAGNVTAAGNSDVFVTKLNSAGAHQWTTTFGDTGTDTGYGVAVDGSGNVHITGFFQGTVDFGAGNVGSAGSYDAFVTKLNSAGAHQWTTTFGGTGGDVGWGVAVDGSGNVHITGYFNGPVNFGAGNVTSAGNDAFVTKLNSAGAHQWTTTFGDTGTDTGYGVAVDGSGNVHVTGYFHGTVDFGAGNVTSAGNSDVFVTKLNAAGAHQWTTTFGDTGTEAGWDVAVDGSANVHVHGWFTGTTDFGAGDVTSAGQNDGFVVKLNSAGQAVVAPSDDDDDDDDGGGGAPPPPPPAPCPWPTAAYAYQSECVEPLKGGISVDADGTLFTVGNLDVTGVTIDLEDGETATDIELVSGGTTTGYVLTSKQRIIGFGDTPTTEPGGTDLVTLWSGETVTQLSNNRNGTYFATSHGRVFDTNGNPYVDLSRYVTTNNIVDIKTLDSGSGILIGSDGSVFNFGVDLFQGSLGGQGVTDIIGGHLVPGGYYLLSATGTIHTFGDIAIAPNITALTTKVFDTETLNGRLIDVTPAGTGLCALGADGGLFDMLGAQHNAVLRAHTNPNTTAIDTTG